MARVTVDIDIEEFDLQDILSHLDNMLMFGWDFQKGLLTDWIRKKNGAGQVGDGKNNTLFETQKIEFFNEHFDKITIEDLENIVNNK